MSSIKDKAIYGFNLINHQLDYFGFKPRYNNYDEYFTLNRFQSHNEAYNQLYQYAKELIEYKNNKDIKLNVIQNMSIIASRSSASLNNNNLNSKSDFLSNKMSFKSINDFDPKPRLTKDQRAALKEAIDAKKTKAFPSLWSITKEGLGVSHNPNYARNDYFNDVIKVKHPTWERTTNVDIDGDEKNDIAIWDGPGRDPNTNLKYYNGWHITKNDLARPYVDYLIKNPNKDQSYIEGYLQTRPGYKKHEPLINISKIFDAFVENIVEAFGEVSPRLKMLMTQFGFKQKLKSMINRFVILPYALVKLGYNPTDIQPIIYNDIEFKYNKKLMAMYRSKAVKKVWLEDGYNAVNNAIENVREKIVALAKEGPEAFILGVVKGNKDIRDIFYEDAVIAGTNDRTVKMEEVKN